MLFSGATRIERAAQNVITADGRLMQRLVRDMKAAREALPPERASEIDAGIEAIEAQGDSWYSTVTIARAFGINSASEQQRGCPSRKAFQGNLYRMPFGAYGGVRFGDSFAAMAVNKSTSYYRTWVDPADAEKALQISHRIERYTHKNVRCAQVQIDRWRLKHDYRELRTARA